MAGSYDVIIIGSGPGGYVAAIRAAQLGLKTAVVEKSYLGGICLNWGCIPTKALLRSADIYHYHDCTPKTSASPPRMSAFDIARGREALARHRRPAQPGRRLPAEEEQGRRDLGRRQAAGKGKVAVETAENAPKGALGAGEYSAKHIIVATGARPRALPGLEPDKKLVWTYFEAMVPPDMPKSLLVVGSGAIGIEFASFFRTLGAEVTVVEILPQILPVEDAEIAAHARKRFEKQGMKIHTDAKVTKLDKGKNDVTATIELKGGKTETLKVDRVISAVGVVGNIEGLGLEELGVKTERGTIVVDGLGRTNVEGVYAIGDVAGSADARAQGGARGRRLRRGDQGPEAASDRQAENPRLHLLQPADRLRRPDRDEGEGGRSRGEGRPLPLHRQRQGDRARRAGGPGQDDLRREDRAASRRASGRRGSDGAHPGICRRDEP